MPDPKTIERLRGLVLSASEIKGMTGWPAPMVEDYLTLLENLIIIANIIDVEIDQTIEEIPTAFTDGSIPYVDSSLLVEDNARLFWDFTNFILNAQDAKILSTTASRLLATDANQKIVSVANLAAWILGTANQVVVTDNLDGTLTLSTPQDIDTDADVTFDTLTIDKAIFNLSAGLTPSEGEICWNTDDGTLNIGMPGGNVVLQVGQEMLLPKSKAIGSNISNGQLVYISGGSGTNPEISLAKADSFATSKCTIAMATESITENQHGYATTNGIVRDVNTIAYSSGTILYLSETTAGAYTNVAPTRPNFEIMVGIVVRSHATEGSIFVCIREKSLLDLQQDNVKLLLGAGSDASTYYDGTDLHIKTDEVAPSDLKLTFGANKTLELQNVVYDDWAFEIAPKTTGAGKPTLASFSGNIKQYTMAVNDISELRPTEMLHKWKEGTPVELHVHWASNGLDATDRGVKWEIDYTWSNGISHGGTTAFAAATTLSNETKIPANTADKSYFYTSVLTFTPVGGKIGAGLLMSLKRIASVTDPTPTSSPWIIMVGVHYQIDTIGSRTISQK